MPRPWLRVFQCSATELYPAAPTTTLCSSIFALVALTGLDAQTALDHAAITVNKNAIPFDTEPITKTGGIRVGTPAMTTRGMKEEEMMEIADLIHAALESRTDQPKLAAIRQEVVRFTSRFPLP